MFYSMKIRKVVRFETPYTCDAEVYKIYLPPKVSKNQNSGFVYVEK